MYLYHDRIDLKEIIGKKAKMKVYCGEDDLTIIVIIKNVQVVYDDLTEVLITPLHGYGECWQDIDFISILKN